MAQSVKYKKPRKINAVSVTLALIVGLLGFLGYQYVPLKLKEGEAVRVLDEAASKFSGRKSRYLEVKEEREKLKAEMASNLRLIGVTDPSMEHWIEIDSKRQIRFGVLYSEWIEWPFDVIEKQEKVYELEYTLHLD